MINQNVLVICIIIAIAIFFATLMIMDLMVFGTSKSKIKAYEYLMSNDNIIYNAIDTAIEFKDIYSTDSIVDFESYKSSVLGTAFANVYEDLYKGKAAEDLKNKEISKRVYNNITVELLRRVVVDEYDINSIFESRMKKLFDESCKGVIKDTEDEDKDLQKEYDEYEAEIKEVDSIPEEDINKIPEDIKLNPQRDEEEDYDPDDDSQEILDYNDEGYINIASDISYIYDNYYEEDE